MTLSLSAKTLKSVHTPYFTLHINQEREDPRIIIWMELHTKAMTTREIPQTFPILKQFLPNILKHKCINNLRQPFYQEVLKTEVGHLFEHILLEYLLELKLSQGEKVISYKGTTSWDWTIYPSGSFYIEVFGMGLDSNSINQAVAKTVDLTEMIYGSIFLDLRRPTALLEPEFYSSDGLETSTLSQLSRATQ